MTPPPTTNPSRTPTLPYRIPTTRPRDPQREERLTLMGGGLGLLLGFSIGFFISAPATLIERAIVGLLAALLFGFIGMALGALGASLTLSPRSADTCTPSRHPLHRGLIRARITVQNPARPDLAPIETSALANTGTRLLCIPQDLAHQMNLQTIDSREITTADGRRLVPYVGPLQLTFGTRTCFTGALVLGTEPLLGTLPMADLDLVIHPTRAEVIPGPTPHNIPTITITQEASP